MARDFYVNGETMVSVKSRSDSSIGSISQLGLSESPIVISPNFFSDDCIVDAWGPNAPVDVQTFLFDVYISMTLVHFDPSVLEICETLSVGGASSIGSTVRAGTRLGGGLARFVPGNNLIGLNLSSPVGGKPWRFYFAYLAQSPVQWPIGTKRSAVRLNWRAIPYTTDPWNGGLGALGNVIYDHTLDT